VSDPAQLPYGGAGDSRAGDVLLADRFRRHSDSLRRSHRSPLYEELMRAAAEDIDRSGVVAQLFETVPTPAGSVPQLRLLAALHYLVLSGRAPALAAFYPSAGGREPVRAVWPVARATLLEHLDWLRARVTPPSRPMNPAARRCCSRLSCGWPTTTGARFACSRSAPAPA
jgi:hypothetical protein